MGIKYRIILTFDDNGALHFFSVKLKTVRSKIMYRITKTVTTFAVWIKIILNLSTDWSIYFLVCWVLLEWVVLTTSLSANVISCQGKMPFSGINVGIVGTIFWKLSKVNSKLSDYLNFLWLESTLTEHVFHKPHVIFGAGKRATNVNG